MNDCIFCRIAAGTAPAAILWQDDDIVAFLERSPIREGHTQIITRAHHETFDSTPPALAAKLLHIGQQLAARLKEVYGVGRVAFMFTGGDIPHVHAHVVPIHEATDVTSARYIVNADGVEFRSAHLDADRDELARVRDALDFRYEHGDTPGPR